MARTETLDTTSQTRFGSSTADLRSAAGVLRAMADRFSMSLSPASDVDLAAAVIAADVWVRATSTSLRFPHRAPASARHVLCAILLRAAGCGPSPALPSVSDCPLPRDEHVALADGYGRWAARLIGPLASRSLRLAAQDLMESPSSSFVVYAEVLLHAADSLEY